ncbi:MAG TPA: aminotransferase class V-fold PLP-dependent enzyme [Rhabdochlamydiaceae bacterium]|jgi:cysteine desulfurase|nr:aminotransferase class V-fold PLP-dependent enzyme [Rhabdochlamydiaceae bacterium]
MSKRLLTDSKEIYLDHQTISRPALPVIERMNHYFLHKWGTLSAPHQKGQELYEDVDAALKKLYLLLGASERNYFVLTTGGAEAIFQMFLNFYLDEIRETGRNHLLTTSIEEAPILLSMSRLEQLGCVTRLLPVDEKGMIKLSALEEALKPKTALLSISWGSSLTGVIQPIADIVRICHAKGVKVHLNASAMVGKLPISFDELGVDFLTFDGDKIGTPQGIGGLFQKTKPHESSRHVAALSGLSLAVEEGVLRMDQFAMETARLRDTFESELKIALPDTVVLFQDTDRLPHVTCAAFPGVMSEALLFYLHRRKLYASLGGGQFQKLSSQLKYFAEELAQTTLSFSISHETTEDDLAEALDIIVSSVRKLSTLSAAL